jgi:hypothetical protein
MRAIVLAAVAGCAVAAPTLPANHPANARATSGRLVGPPASLRPGVIVYTDVPVKPIEPPAHHHHHAP